VDTRAAGSLRFQVAARRAIGPEFWLRLVLARSRWDSGAARRSAARNAGLVHWCAPRVKNKVTFLHSTAQESITIFLADSVRAAAD